jgi:hypothetical protein
MVVLSEKGFLKLIVKMGGKHGVAMALARTRVRSDITTLLCTVSSDLRLLTNSHLVKRQRRPSLRGWFSVVPERGPPFSGPDLCGTVLEASRLKPATAERLEAASTLAATTDVGVGGRAWNSLCVFLSLLDCWISHAMEVYT